MGIKSVAILLILLLCWWLIKKWSDKRTSSFVGKRLSREDSVVSGNTVAQKNHTQPANQPGDERRGVTRKTAPIKTADTGLIPPGDTSQSGTGTQIDFNRIEVDRATHKHRTGGREHGKQIPDLSIPLPGNHIGNQSVAFNSHFESANFGANANPREVVSLRLKVKYLEKQIHENNRDITMLSDNTAKLREVNRLNQEQHVSALRSEKDKVLFFETRLAAEIEKLAQIESKLDRKGLTLDQFSEVITRCEELETKLTENSEEITQLKEILVLSRGYQTGSNKRNKELTLIRKQVQRIEELESQLAMQMSAEPP